MIELGVDQLGVVPSRVEIPGAVTYTAARTICEAVGSRAKTVALSVEVDVDAIAEMAKAVKPDVLQLAGDMDRWTPRDVTAVRRRWPQASIMQAVPIAGTGGIEIARAFETVADLLLLDSVSSDVVGIGATGEVHDWNISREIVRQSRVPVILAGGLSPKNVAAAIRTVRPWGVDSFTYTNRTNSDGRVTKDLQMVRSFVQEATRAFHQIELEGD